MLDLMWTHDAIILTHVMVFILVALAWYQMCGAGCLKDTSMAVD